MGLENVALIAFNRGRISRLALARTDIKRVSFSADVMNNWMARVMGPMMMRPGLGYTGAIPSAPRVIPFVFATSDTALLEFTNDAMRIWVGDVLLQRTAVTTAIANGNFDANLTSWTDDDEVGGVSAWVAGGYMGLTGTGTAAAIRTQAVTIAAVDQDHEHAIRIVVQRGPVTFRLGTTAGGDEVIGEMTLDTGVYSMVFTPSVGTGTIYVRFISRLARQVLVDSCNIETDGIVSLPSPYETADLDKIRFDQSADVIYLACYGTQQRKVERIAARSWALVRYQVNDGPLRAPNVSAVTITPSALTGNITLTASTPLFKSTQAPSTDNDGAIFRVTCQGQNVTATAVAQNTFTAAIQVEGTGTQRVFAITLSGLSATGSTVTLQRSLVSSSGTWTDVKTWVADTTETYDDTLSNQIAWYRIGVKVGGYAAGTIAMSLAYTVGFIDGYARVTAYTSTTVVSAEVLTDLGNTTATDDWAEGEWSDARGWPSATKLYDGRLNWSGKGGFWGSISDGYESFDESVTGDAGSLNENMGSGPLDNINWMLALARLICGAEGSELSVKTSALDEPITPTNFHIKPDSTQGSADVDAIRVDSRGYFVQRGGTRVFELDRPDGADYKATDITILIPEICSPYVVRMAVQRQPDTRIHCILSDGTAAVAVIDRVESVLCWLNVSTSAGDLLVDVCVLPGAAGSGEDAVYYVVARQVNGATVYHLERWALESECVGGTTNKQADAFVTYAQAASATIGGLTHLIGRSVVVWDNGKCLRDANNAVATFVVDGTGSITVTNAGVAYQATIGMVGLAYTAQWKSSKLAHAAQGGSALNQRKNFNHLGLILDRTHHRGVQYGPDFVNLSDMPGIEDGTTVAEDTIWSHYDKDTFEFEGEWNPDSRLCLQAVAPRPACILAATLPIEEKSKR